MINVWGFEPRAGKINRKGVLYHIWASGLKTLNVADVMECVPSYTRSARGKAYILPHHVLHVLLSTNRSRPRRRVASRLMVDELVLFSLTVVW